MYNISAKEGVAARTGDQLRAAGFKVTEVGNLPVPDVTATTVYFSDAEGEHATADEVGQKLQAPVEARIPALADQPPGVIVLSRADTLARESFRTAGRRARLSLCLNLPVTVTLPLPRHPFWRFLPR